MHKRTLFLTQFSILVALEAIVCFTPLGSIPIGPLVATLMMVPVIITGLQLGTAAGTAMGAIAGMFSFIVWTFMPPSPAAFLFTPFYSMGELRGNALSLLICFVPRILAGTTAGLFHRRRAIPVIGFGAALASFVNTSLVFLGILAFFRQGYLTLMNQPYGFILSILAANVLLAGLAEAAIAAVVAMLVRPVLRRIYKE